MFLRRQKCSRRILVLLSVCILFVFLYILCCRFVLHNFIKKHYVLKSSGSSEAYASELRENVTLVVNFTFTSVHNVYRMYIYAILYMLSLYY